MLINATPTFVCFLCVQERTYLFCMGHDHDHDNW